MKFNLSPFEVDAILLALQNQIAACQGTMVSLHQQIARFNATQTPLVDSTKRTTDDTQQPPGTA